MFPDEIDYLMRKEHYDRLREEAERERFIRATQLQPGSYHKPGRRVAIWMGAHLIDWGLKLQQRYRGSSAKLIR